ncbi:CHAD domain-containing protein [Tepidamorphus gemmatus]|uniref:CHAD domain-containing protein n=1 Tax=Tepidamorphus gemmatus TaxID=747076 RepID=A0A4V2UXZ6_9HYPH|nr:CHAD domain-containing protein [Tepidamorphus gemmatus]
MHIGGRIGAEVNRALTDLLGSAVTRLVARRGDVHEIVHDARKDLKAFRSYLRLVRGIVDAEAFRRLNAAARDAARSLSEARDAQALHDAISQLEMADRRGLLDIAALRRAADTAVGGSAGRKAVRDLCRQVAGDLRPIRDEVAGWNLTDDRDAYLDGLATTYRAARKALRKGFGSGLAGELHEARKRVIHWRYQLELFSGLWPRAIKAEVRELQDLREDLGQHNDLVLLQQRIAEEVDGFAGLPQREACLDAILVLRAERTRTAARRAGLVFCDAPRARRRRLQAWWAAQLR